MYDLAPIKYALAVKGLDPHNLWKGMAEKLGEDCPSSSTIQKMFDPDSNPRPATVKAVADFLGVPMERLIPEELRIPDLPSEVSTNGK